MANTTIRFINPQFIGLDLTAKIYTNNDSVLQSTVTLTEDDSETGLFDGIVTEPLAGVYRYIIYRDGDPVGYGFIELYDTEDIYTADTDSARPKTPVEGYNPELDSWENLVIQTLRALTGDMDEERYTDERLVQSFLVCSNLVMFDVSFEEDFVINLKTKEVTPEPTKDFISLGCLKTACVLLNSESREASGCKISMKDGPSSINLDKTDLVKTLSSLGKSACAKYEEASFIFKSEGTVGVAIFGPHGLGLTGHGDNSRIYR